MTENSLETATALSELRELGLTIEIGDAVAGRIKAELLIIEGLLYQGAYGGPDSSDLPVAAAYQAIANEIVTAATTQDVIDTVIPTVVMKYVLSRQWRVFCMGDLESMRIQLYGPITEWRGRLLRMQVQTQSQPHKRLKFPKRAVWLQQRLKERGWDHNDPIRYNGPDRKTVQKILRGESVREDVLEKLAQALSAKVTKVNPEHIPSE